MKLKPAAFFFSLASLKCLCVYGFNNPTKSPCRLLHDRVNPEFSRTVSRYLFEKKSIYTQRENEDNERENRFTIKRNTGHSLTSLDSASQSSFRGTIPIESFYVEEFRSTRRTKSAAEKAIESFQLARITAGLVAQDMKIIPNFVQSSIDETRHSIDEFKQTAAFFNYNKNAESDPYDIPSSLMDSKSDVDFQYESRKITINDIKQIPKKFKIFTGIEQQQSPPSPPLPPPPPPKIDDEVTTEMALEISLELAKGIGKGARILGKGAVAGLQAALQTIQDLQDVQDVQESKENEYIREGRYVSRRTIALTRKDNERPFYEKNRP